MNLVSAKYTFWSGSVFFLFHICRGLKISNRDRYRIFRPLTCHHMKLDYNFFDFQTNYQSPSEKFSDGDFSYGDGLIGITILIFFYYVKSNILWNFCRCHYLIKHSNLNSVPSGSYFFIKFTPLSLFKYFLAQPKNIRNCASERT